MQDNLRDRKAPLIMCDIPHDCLLPQNSEGEMYFSKCIWPTNSENTLIIEDCFTVQATLRHDGG